MPVHKFDDYLEEKQKTLCSHVPLLLKSHSHTPDHSHPSNNQSTIYFTSMPSICSTSWYLPVTSIFL